MSYMRQRQIDNPNAFRCSSSRSPFGAFGVLGSVISACESLKDNNQLIGSYGNDRLFVLSPGCLSNRLGLKNDNSAILLFASSYNRGESPMASIRNIGGRNVKSSETQTIGHKKIYINAVEKIIFSALHGYLIDSTVITHRKGKSDCVCRPMMVQSAMQKKKDQYYMTPLGHFSGKKD